MKKEVGGYTQLFISGLISGIAPILIRQIRGLNSETIVFIRGLMLVIFLGAYLLFYRGLKPLRDQKGMMVFFGFLHAFILFSYYSAIRSLPIATAVFLMYTFPVWIFVFSLILLKDRPTKLEFLGLLLALIGIGIIFTPENFLDNNLIGLILGLSSGIGAGLVYVLSQKLDKYDKVSLTFWRDTLALPFVGLMVLFNLPKGGSITLPNISLLAILSITALVAAVIIFNAFGRLKANKAGVFMLTEVIWPVLLATIFFGEIPGKESLIAGMFIMAGAYFVTR